MQSGHSLNFPVLPLPDGEETIAFRAVESILRNDVTLSGVTQLFLAWRGEVEDTWNPSLTTCPFLRISPAGMPSRRESETQHRMPMRITFEAAVVGSNVTAMTNYWAAIRRALFPQNNPTATAANRAIMQAAGVSNGILMSPAYGVIKVGSDGSLIAGNTGGQAITLAVGTLELVMLIMTP